jgi:hypothetical protein
MLLVYQYPNQPVAQPMSQQQTLTQPIAMQQSAEKRKTRSSAIKIVDPSTGLEVNTEDLTKSSGASHTTLGSVNDTDAVSRRNIEP